MDSFWNRNDGVYFGFGSEATQGNPPPLDDGTAIRYVGDRHLVTVGPNGSGKSRRLLLPNLHDLTKWSVVVVDPKGDLACMTAAYREAHGSKIVRLNPFDVLKLGSDGFNPVAVLDPHSEDFADDAMGLAEAIIRVEGREPHWSQSAQELICALIMYVRLVLPKPSLADVRTLLGRDSGELRKTVIDEAIEYNGLTIPGMLEVARLRDFPALEAKASRFADVGPENRELTSILSVALTQTRWLDSDPIKGDLGRGFFDFGKLKDEPTTVYLMLPARRLATHSTWLRLMITSILQPLMKDTRKSKVPVLLMLDEFAQLGHLPVIEQTMAMMRGFGIKLWTVFQDFSQAKAIYGERWETFLNNAGVVQAFAPQDVLTAKSLSEFAGQTTKTPLAAGNVGPQASLSRTQVQVPLMLPQDFRNMDDGFATLHSHKLKGVACTYLPYPTELHYLDAICALDPAN